MGESWNGLVSGRTTLPRTLSCAGWDFWQRSWLKDLVCSVLCCFPFNDLWQERRDAPRKRLRLLSGRLFTWLILANVFTQIIMSKHFKTYYKHESNSTGLIGAIITLHSSSSARLGSNSLPLCSGCWGRQPRRLFYRDMVKLLVYFFQRQIKRKETEQDMIDDIELRSLDAATSHV